MQLENISAIVTGGASGLGAATAQAFIQRGVRVTAFDLRAPEYDGVEFAEVDVTDAAAVREAVQAAQHADAPLRLAINCAGICPSARIFGRKGPHDPDLFAKTININLMGTFHVMTAAAEAMAATEPVDEDGQRGVIINTASVAAFEGQVGQAPRTLRPRVRSMRSRLRLRATSRRRASASTRLHPASWRHR